jgi:hypothetical protein
MRMTLVILLCASAGVARAQTTEQCHSMQGAGDILACYDGTTLPVAPRPKRANPPNAAVAPIAKESAAISKLPAEQQAPYVDVLAVENSKLDTKMKTICRGC